MRKALSVAILIFAFLTSAFVHKDALKMDASTAYDLITAVNELRTKNGLASLETNTALMAAGKVQSDYLASIGYTNITNGHVGPGGSYAIDRAIAAGYPVAQGIDVQDCWAFTSINEPISALFLNSSIWNDAEHMNLILNKYAKHVGAGVTEKDGFVYYDLVISYDWSITPKDSGTPSVSIPTKSTTPQVAPVVVAAPQADGSIVHVVQPNQALWSIAIAYGTTIEQLRQLNNFQSANTIIPIGYHLLIRPAFTPTPMPTVTTTPRQPTRTPVPAQIIETMQIAPTKSAASAPSFMPGLDRTTTGLILILLCGIGLVLVIMGTLRRKK